MREIRFRVFYRGKMYPVLELHGYVHPMIAVEMELDGLGLRHVSLDSEHVEGLMQYTGLKDKNEKQIYEGDIVHCSIEGDNIGNVDVIQFKDASFWLRYRDRSIPSWIEFGNELEVIGNIYENPELKIKTNEQ